MTRKSKALKKTSKSKRTASDSEDLDSGENQTVIWHLGILKLTSRHKVHNMALEMLACSVTTPQA